MSALVAYQSHVQRVVPVIAASPVRRDDDSTSPPPSSSSPSITTRGDVAAVPLMALLGRTGLSGPDGTTVGDATTSGDVKVRLQQALSTLQQALNGAAGDDTTESEQSGTAPAVDDAIQTILGALAPTPVATPAPSAESTVNTDESGQGVAASPPKPNLDALHRVLAHYTAQSAAASSIVTLVR